MRATLAISALVVIAAAAAGIYYFAGPGATGGGSGPDGGEKQNGGGVTISYAREPAKILIEPETGEIRAPYSIEQSVECGGGACLSLPEGPGAKEIHPKLKTAPGAGGTPVPYSEIKEQKHAGKHLYPNGTFRVTFNVEKAGEYILWGRVWWNSSCGNSFYFLIDPKADPVDTDGNGEFDDEIVPVRFGEDGHYRAWHWLKCSGITFHLDPGEHTLAGYNREDGHRIDQLLLVQKDEDYDFYPSGIEKSEQSGN